MLPRTLVVLLAMSFCIALPSVASAQGPSGTQVSNAVQLKQDGDRAMDALRYDDALAAYQKAYALSKDPPLLYNQARAFQALGDYASALEYLERFEADAPPAIKARVPDLKGLEVELQGKVATLILTCNTPGAEVVLQDKVIGITPLPGPYRTTAGHVTLAVHADKYQPFKRDLDLTVGGPVSVVVELVPKDLSAALVVRSAVAGARVSVDGRIRGNVPVEVLAPAGVHELRVELAGYDTSVVSVVLSAGARREVDVPLVKKPPITAKWWFWTTLGAIVAGGVATYFVVTTERSPDRGSISPGVVSAPLHF
jgi:hypothetical protein